MSELAQTVMDAMVRSPWLSAVVVLLVGLAAALLARLLLSKLLELVRFNVLSDRMGLTEFLRKGRVRHPASRVVGMLGFWIILIVAFFWIARILDIKVLRSTSDRIAQLAPGFVAALFIAAIGLVVVSFVANFVSTLARNAGHAHPLLLARVVRWMGSLVIVIIALEQINLAGSLLSTLLLILVAAAALGVALAFGLGCKDLAREAMLKFLHGLREEGRTRKGPDLEG